MELTEGSLVLCTVKKIDKTNIFLTIEEDGEGSMVLSEVAAGRIRNLRDYVSPNKKVVCKVLNITKGHVELSLRRVTGKEKESVLERHKKERRFMNILKTAVPDAEARIKKIKEENDFLAFMEDAQGDSSLLSRFFSKEEAEKLAAILVEKSEKEKEIKKIFKISSTAPEGISDIKEILNIPDAEIHYLGSSKFSIVSKAPDFKEANKKIATTLEKITKKAKEKKCSFEMIEK